ncbi:hypothetical protein ACFVRD_48605, partial [Streptomyces sp. NPDC057908]
MVDTRPVDGHLIGAENEASRAAAGQPAAGVSAWRWRPADKVAIMPTWRLRDFRDDDMDRAIQIWDQDRQDDDMPPVFPVSEAMASEAVVFPDLRTAFSLVRHRGGDSVGVVACRVV